MPDKKGHRIEVTLVCDDEDLDDVREKLFKLLDEIVSEKVPMVSSKIEEIEDYE